MKDDISTSNETDKAQSLLKTLAFGADVLFGLSDAELLDIAREMLAVFTFKSNDWAHVEDWSLAEMELYGKAKFEKGASAVRLRTALAIGNCLRSYIERFEYTVGNSNGKKIKPELLRKTRQVGERKIFGPVSAGLLGGEFEIWTRPKDVPIGKKSKGVNLVLGAGNQSMVSALDTLHFIFNERKAVLLKHHPLRPWLLAPYAIIFEPLIKKGFMAQLLDEGVHVSTKLVSNPIIDHVHITGSLDAFNKIKKTLASAHRNKTKHQIDSMISGELGCVSPWIINPGNYSTGDLKHAVCSIVASKKNNGGANCVAGQVLVLPKHWDQLKQFRTALLKELIRQPDSIAYYPGSHKRKEDILSAYDTSQVQHVASRSVKGCDMLDQKDAVTIIECGTPGTQTYNDKALKIEAFGPVLAVVELEYEKSKEEDYLENVAVPFVNDKSNIFGCLSCNIITPNETTNGEKVQKAIENLNYGMIAVNEWAALAILPYVLGGVWGPYALDKTGQSGAGFIGNQYAIPHVEKMVLFRSLNVRPAFDEVSQPPSVFICYLGFSWATRSSSNITLVLRRISMTLEAFHSFVAGICFIFLSWILPRSIIHKTKCMKF